MRKLKWEEMDRPSVGDFKEQAKYPVVLVLDFVRSHRNVGAIFRCADTFSIEKVWLCGPTPQPPHWEIRKTALGSTQSVEWEHEMDTVKVLRQLKAAGYRILAIELTDDSISLPEFTPVQGEKVALVVGHEIEGVSEGALALCEAALEIPQLGTKHSLNVGITAGIVLYHFTVGGGLIPPHPEASLHP